MLSPIAVCVFALLLLSEVNSQLIGNESDAKTFFTAENPVRSITFTVANGMIGYTRILVAPFINCYACTSCTPRGLGIGGKINGSCQECFYREWELDNVTFILQHLCSERECASYEQMWSGEGSRDICCSKPGCAEVAENSGHLISSTEPDHEVSSPAASAEEIQEDVRPADKVNSQLIGNESDAKTFFTAENPVSDIIFDLANGMIGYARILVAPFINCYACTSCTPRGLGIGGKINGSCQECFYREWELNNVTFILQHLCSERECASYEQMWSGEGSRDICCSKPGCAEVAENSGHLIYIQSTTNASPLNNVTNASTFGCYHCTPCTQSDLETEPRIGGCQHCIYRETLHSRTAKEISRVCTGEKECVSFDLTWVDTGQRQICCKGEDCNENWDTAKRSQPPNLV